MEQKTEASQAVDERQEYEAFQKWMSEKKAQPFADMEWEAWKDGRACLRAALKAQPAEIDPALLRALKEACDLAMKNTVAARVPECGDFGAIAQDLDYVISQLKAQPAPTEAAQGAQLSGNSGELAQGEGSARLDAGCDCDSPEWCKNYNRCHRQVCGFELRGATPKPV